MGCWAFFYLLVMCLFILFLPQTCMGSVRNFGKLDPGFQGSQMNWIDNDGLFLLSNNSNFAFGFNPTSDVTLFLLAVIHLSSSRVVWSANRASPVQNSDVFIFGDDGNASLKSKGTVIWSTNSGGKGVSGLELHDSGNLILIGKDGSVIWQSFSHPTDTLLSNQEFVQGMKLVSNRNSNNLSNSLEIKSGDIILSVAFKTPQPYWSMAKDNRITINNNGGDVILASIKGNSWRFYDKNKVFLWQFIFVDDTGDNATWAAVLENNGFINFYNLQSKGGSNSAPKSIPNDPCDRPEACDPYLVCRGQNTCQCPSGLNSVPNCKPKFVSSCNGSDGSIALVNAGNGISYFALEFVDPTLSKIDLEHCKSSCLGNCSCIALFYDNNSRNCFMFDQIGSLQGSRTDNGIVALVKMKAGEGGSSNKHFPSVVVIIVIVTILVICGLIFLGVCYYNKKNRKLTESLEEGSEEDDFLESISGMPIRFSYRDLQTATNNFSVKLGQGGFGSVYSGILKDGTRLAVKQLEGIGQGKKEFRAEVSIIGSIHHHHLVRLRGFCAEGVHRLLVYEFMANGSLDRWIFRKNKEEFMLDWDVRYNIAVGTAKGLAYLHEDCDVKIVHCDIKPENILLDDNFLAKVSDFGLAKLMTREQSHVFTNLRGTRGYLAPEWITNYAISEKSDVYSYGMVLLETIGGRKNYDSSETSDKSNFPSYAFKMFEEGRFKDILDTNLKIHNNDERVMIAIKVALWCIQDDMSQRPPMMKVVQMLEGVCPVPLPPTTSQMGARLYTNFFKSISEEEGTGTGTETGTGTGTGTASLGPVSCYSDAYLSAVRLSGPR